MNETNCAHDGRLINQCIDCIRKNASANGVSFELRDSDCAFIANIINEFFRRDSNCYTHSEIDDDLMGDIDERFEFYSPEIIELIEVLIFG